MMDVGIEEIIKFRKDLDLMQKKRSKVAEKIKNLHLR